jgi:hypothetical protein
MDSQSEEILARLERLAKDLDAQQYPGEAWPTAIPPTPRRRVWRVAGLIAAIAASVAVLIHFLGTPPRREDPAPGTQDVVVREPATPVEAPAEDIPVPAILVVEDHDSYSFIDMMADVPLVSFAKRDTYMPECVVPLLPDATTPLPIDSEL